MAFRLPWEKKRVKTPIFGLLAEFSSADDLLEAVNRSRAAGYRSMEAYTPMPLHEVAHALGYRSDLPKLVLGGGILGGILGFAMQYYASVKSYPLDIGSRPDNSWPAFIIITFEMTILFAALAAVFGMFALSRLPRPHHPVFGVPIFELASRNRFFLLIMAHDEHFELGRTGRFLDELPSLTVTEVPNE
jgi:hypothetical protein